MRIGDNLQRATTAQRQQGRAQSQPDIIDDPSAQLVHRRNGGERHAHLVVGRARVGDLPDGADQRGEKLLARPEPQVEVAHPSRPHRYRQVSFLGEAIGSPPALAKKTASSTS